MRAFVAGGMMSVSCEGSDLFLQPGNTMSNVTIPRYSENLDFMGVVKAGKIHVIPDGSVKVERLWAGFWSGGSCKSFLKSESAILERKLSEISTSARTELRMNGIHLVTDSGLAGDLEALEFQSVAGFELECQPSGEASLQGVTATGGQQRRPSWKLTLGVRQEGRGPLVEPKSTGHPYWFDGRIDRSFAFHTGSGSGQEAAAGWASMLAKGPGMFRMNSGEISSHGGVLIRLPVGLIACGDGFTASWSREAPAADQRASKLMPQELLRLRAGGGCQIRVTNRKGQRFVISCEELKYSGKTGLISLGGGYPRIESEEGFLIATDEHQFLRVDADGRLKLGPGHWQSEQSL